MTESADVADLKSVASNSVWVQVPLSAPVFIYFNFMDHKKGVLGHLFVLLYQIAGELPNGKFVFL